MVVEDYDGLPLASTRGGQSPKPPHLVLPSYGGQLAGNRDCRALILTVNSPSCTPFLISYTRRKRRPRQSKAQQRTTNRKCSVWYLDEAFLVAQLINQSEAVGQDNLEPAGQVQTIDLAYAVNQHVCFVQLSFVPSFFHFSSPKFLGSLPLTVFIGQFRKRAILGYRVNLGGIAHDGKAGG